jgi:SlyX protein
MSDANEERITELEIKIAHQEVLIEDLRSALDGHHQILERLEKSIKIITDRYESGLVPSNVGPGNEKPPPY